MRHLEVKDLWLQQQVIKGDVVVQKVRGTENPADLMTKVSSREDIRSRLERLCLRIGGSNEGAAQSKRWARHWLSRFWGTSGFGVQQAPETMRRTNLEAYEFRMVM